MENYSKSFDIALKAYLSRDSNKKKDTEPSNFFIQASIHLFLGRLLGFGCINFNKEDNQETKYNQNSQNQQKWQIFQSLFTIYPKTTKLKYLDPLKLNKTIVHLQFLNFSNSTMERIDKCNNKSLPLLFSENIESYLSLVESFPIITLNDEEIQQIFNLLWLPFQFSIFESRDSEKNSEIITPGTLSYIYENFQAKKQKKTLQQGIFYTPKEEIQFTILTSLYEYFISFYSNPSKETRKTLFNILYSLITQKIESIDNGLFKNHIQFVNEIIIKLFKIKILDPACGSGGFLIEFALLIQKLLSLVNKKEFSEVISPKNCSSHNCLYLEIIGVDINPWGVILTDFRLWVINYQNRQDNQKNERKQPKLIYKIINRDFILSSKFSSTKDLKFQEFNLIIGNPPYIRNRDITDPFHPSLEGNRFYRLKIQKELENIPNFPNITSKRLDYYVYFYLQSFKLLSVNGVLGFIVSNSWMNVKYGYEFQEFLCKNSSMKLICETDSRSFEKAQINTVITIFQKLEKDKEMKNKTKFIRFGNSYYNLLTQPQLFAELAQSIIQNILEDKKSRSTEQIRIIKVNNNRIAQCSQNFIYSLKFNEKYRGYNWANYYFYAPDWFFQIILNPSGVLIPIKDIAKISRGITTNCNNYFILHKIDSKKPNQISFINGYGDTFHFSVGEVKEFFTPIINSPKQLPYPGINLEFITNNIDTYIFYTSLDLLKIQQLKAQNVINYVKYGETKKILVKKGTSKNSYVNGVIELASFHTKYIENPKSWYCLKRELKKGHIQSKKELIIQKIFNTTVKVAQIPINVMINNTFYKISLKPEYKGEETLILGLLLGSLSKFCIEIEGRTNFGGGALDTASFDIGNILIPNPLFFKPKRKKSILQQVEKLTKTPYFTYNQKILPESYNKLNKLLYSDLSILHQKELKKHETTDYIPKIQIPLSFTRELCNIINSIESLRISRASEKINRN
ncbi:MAG: Eco57I restriction-modification methylase domain-containing protein [Promethearchaeota archaeon]